MWFCYILRNTQSQFKNNTYNGSTNNPVRRLRQHNGEIAGGARATSLTNGGWEFCALLSGFPDHVNCLSCEWRIKCPSGRPGRRDAKYRGPAGRVRSLNEVIPLERWTGKCVVDNHDHKFKLHITNDMRDHIDETIVPPNIEVVCVDNITAGCMEMDLDVHV